MLSPASKVHEAGDPDDVARYDGVLRVLEHPVQRRLGRRLGEGGVDVLDGRIALHHRGEVGDGADRQRDPQREPVEASLHGLQDEAGGLGRAGRGRHDVDGRPTGPSGVLVRQVEQVLIVRVGVHRRHEPADDLEGVVDHLHHRDEAVRGARRVGDDEVRRRGRTRRR